MDRKRNLDKCFKVRPAAGARRNLKLLACYVVIVIGFVLYIVR